MTKFYNKFKKPCFWLIFGPFFHFPNLGAKKFFLENTAVTHNLIWVSSTRPKFKKN